jgi:hypothetical protein
MPFPLPVGHKFACVALANAGTARGINRPHDLTCNQWVLFEPPFDLDDAWREWLGSIQCERLTRSNLVLFVHAASQNPRILDAENQGLEQHVLSLLYALFLVEVFYQEGRNLSRKLKRGRQNKRPLSEPDE